MLPGSSDGEEDFDVLGPISWPVKSYSPMGTGPLRLPKACSWRFSVRGALSLMLLWDDADRFGIRNVYSMAPL